MKTVPRAHTRPVSAHGSDWAPVSYLIEESRVCKAAATGGQFAKKATMEITTELESEYGFTLQMETVPCPACGAQLGEHTTDWCRCVGRMVSPSCGACGVCLCKVTDRARLEFWRNAPAWVRSRQQAELDHRAATRAQDDGSADVLIVDDDEDLRLLAAYSVQQMGYRVVLASGGHDALALLESRRFKVMITDAFMPKMDGRELCQTVKARYPFMKVVIMTSLYKAPHYKYEAYKKFRADEYLTKPIDFGRLYEVMLRMAPTKAAVNS
jgi:CheY-like chemotaxis protein